MTKKILIILLLTVAIGFNNFWWFTKSIDSSLTLDSEMGNHFYTKRSLEDLKKICLKIDTNTSKADLIYIINKHVKDAEIFEKSGNVYCQSLGFIFEGEKLVEISEDIPFNEDSKG